ncbi:precorrin-8X methylmutase [Stappia sp.]|uniref:precorrin-8X methylmutase n=1 Tax=Stappia sp. TaxID=1870903 RepID=UPI0032D91CFD
MIADGPPRYDYERDPAAIYRQSFAIVRGEADLDAVPAALHPAAIRLIHACGMPEVIADLAWTGDIAERTGAALRAGAPVLTDVRMVAEGIIADRLPARNRVICTLGDPRVPGLARELGTTRSAAAVDLWRDDLDGAVVVVGNAPTALFHLLERIGAGFPRPAAILGFPVGFVGAAESKDALLANPFAIPCLVLRGRRGGSAMAAAALNALAGGVPEEARP